MCRVATAQDERSVSTVLALGFPHMYPSLVSRPASAYRICWYGEPLPLAGPSRAQRAMRAVPSARVLDLAGDHAGRLLGNAERRRLRQLRERAAIERELGRNARRLRTERKAIHEFVMCSQARAVAAAAIGVEARVVPYGYHAALAGPIVPTAGPRDIAVLSLGRDVRARTRRASVLARVMRDLGPGIEVASVDRDLYGAERAALLARSRIVLEVRRVPASNSTVRYLLATAAGAALVAEPGDAWPLEADVHLVEARADRLADAVRELLDDEPHRCRLVSAGQELLGGRLSMRRSVRDVLRLDGNSQPRG